MTVKLHCGKMLLLICKKGITLITIENEKADFKLSLFRMFFNAVI